MARIEHGDDDLIARCYEAGAGRLPWPGVMQEIAERLSLALAVIFGVDVRQQRLLYTFEGGPVARTASLVDYARHFHRSDPFAAHAAQIPAGQFLSFSEIWTPEEIERHPYHLDFNVPYGLRHIHGLKLFQDEGRAIMLGVHRGIGQEPLTGADRTVAERIGFHLGRAIQIFAKLRTSFGEAAVGRVMLDRIGSAVLLVDAARGVHEMNQKADTLLAAGTCLSLDARHRLRCVEPGADARLGEALEALHLGHDPRDGTGAAAERRLVPVPVPRSQRPLVLSLLALRPETTMAAFGSGPLAMVVAYDSNRMAELDAFAVGAAFDLTPAEARVAVRLASGATREAVAEELGLSVHTVNTQVRSALAKVGLGRTSELVALLRSVPLSA